MISVSKEVAIIAGSGLALLIIERVFSFIRWFAKWNESRRKEMKEEVTVNPGELTDRQLMEKIFGKIHETKKDVSDLALTLTKTNSEVGFLAKHQAEANSQVKALIKDFMETKVKHGERFATLEALVKPRRVSRG